MRAALKLNGEYVGHVDGVDRFTETNDDDEILAEAFPDGNRRMRHFILSKTALCSPPDFLTVTTDSNAYFVRIENYPPDDDGIKILHTETFNGYCITVFNLCGKSYVSYDGKQTALYELGESLQKVTVSESFLCGFTVVTIAAKKRLCVLSSLGNLLFCEDVNDYSTGDMLRLTQNYASCVGYYSRKEYSYDGNTLTLFKNAVERQYEPTAAIKHFAFFEGLLFSADCEEYLTEELKPQIAAIKNYLGDYSHVVVPTGDFYARHGDVLAVALAYRVKKNFFNLKYYTVDVVGDKIDNIKTAEL